MPAPSRYFPSCLAETGAVWPVSWSEPLHLLCATHQTMLQRCCPHCRRPRFASTAWMTHDTPAWVCSEPATPENERRQPRTHHVVCGWDLRTVPTPAADESAVTSQLRLWQAATDADQDPDRQDGSYAGFRATNRDLFDAVLELVVEQLGDPRLLVSDSARAAPLLLPAVQVAFDVLDQPDPQAAVDLAERHRLLNPAGTVTPVGPERVLGQRRRNPLLASIRLATLHERLPPSTQLVFRSGSGRPRYPSPPRQPGGPPLPDQVQLAWIPQLIWPGQLTPWIDDRDYRDRAAAAMLLAKVGSARPWRTIAIDLGLPASFSVFPPNLVRSLRRHGAWPAVLRRLDELAQSLERHPPPIDYQARRWAAARYDHVIAAVNHTMAHLGPPYPWCHTHLLTEIFWQQYTGGDLRLAAPASGTLLDPDLYHQDERHIEPITDPALLAFLTVTASTMNRSRDQTQEPLTWQPP